jgi:hypothetical protein
MDREQLTLHVLAAIISGWIAGIAKVMRRNTGERRRVAWGDVFLETPAAISCGLIGGGLAIALGHAHPLVIAAAAGLASHLGAPLMTDMAVAFWRRFLGTPQQKD